MSKVLPFKLKERYRVTWRNMDDKIVHSGYDSLYSAIAMIRWCKHQGIYVNSADTWDSNFKEIKVP